MIKKILVGLALWLCIGVAHAQFMGYLYYANQSSAQGEADYIHAWLIANDAAYAASVAAGQTLRWDVPHQNMVPIDPQNPFSDYMPDPNDKRYYIITTMRCWGALTGAQQSLITVPLPQTFLRLTDKTNLMTDASTGLRDY